MVECNLAKVEVASSNLVSRSTSTGTKWDDKIYYRHTGYIGGLKETTAREMVVKHPTSLIMEAVKGMLPKNKLGRAQLKKLKVYAGTEHPHSAQQPEELTL